MRKGQLVDKIITLLTVHTYIENEVMYPRVRELLPDLEDDVLESYEEHHVADLIVMELVGMKPDAERFTAKTTVLIENVRHHIEEEEQEWFPKVREGLRPQGAAGARPGHDRGQEEGADQAEPAECPEEDRRRGHQVGAHDDLQQGDALAPAPDRMHVTPRFTLPVTTFRHTAGTWSVRLIHAHTARRLRMLPPHAHPTRTESHHGEHCQHRTHHRTRDRSRPTPQHRDQGRLQDDGVRRLRRRRRRRSSSRSAISDDNSEFGATKAWLFVTILTVGYMISRGLAKSGSRDFYDDDTYRTH